MIRAFSLRRNRAALRRLGRRFGANRRGMAAVEFAIALPLMLSLYFGTIELGQGVMIDRKMSDLTRALADLTSQTTTIADADLSNIFDAATSILTPFTGAARMSIASVVIDSAGVAKVCWSGQRNSTAPARGSTVALPTDLKIASTSLIMATTSYDFTPTLGYVLTGTIRINGGTIYMRPRIGKIGGTGSIEQVERSNVAMCPLYT